MLVNDTPPSGSVDVLATELAAAVADGRLSAYVDQSVEIDQVTLSTPHPYYVLDADDLPDDDALPVVGRYAGWRYLLEVNGRVVGLATTSVDEDRELHRFGGIGMGPVVSSVVFAVHIADGLLRDRPGGYTIAALDYPAVHLVVLQVCPVDGEETAYLPIGLASGLHPARLYARAEIRQQVRRMAARMGVESGGGGPVGG
jgi:hypothetical protein